MCPRVRFWFDRNGLDWHDFKKNGIDADILLAIEDNRTITELVVKAAMERENGQRR